MQWIRQNARYVALGVGLFLLFVYLRFPMERYRSKFEQAIGKALSNSTVNIGSMSTTLLPGVELKRVKISTPSQPAGLELEKIRLRWRLLPLLLLRFTMGFEAELSQVEISGSFSRGILGRDFAALEVNLDAATLQPFFAPGYLSQNLMGAWKQHLIETNPLLGSLIASLTLQGALSAQTQWQGARAAFKEFSLADLNGNLRIKGKKIALTGLVPGDLDLGNLDVDWQLRQGKGELEKLDIKGKDLVITGKGEMKFEKPPKAGNINVEIKIEVPSSARANMAGTLNMALLPMGVEMKDGRSAFKITGALGTGVPPRLVPIQ